MLCLSPGLGSEGTFIFFYVELGSFIRSAPPLVPFKLSCRDMTLYCTQGQVAQILEKGGKTVSKHSAMCVMATFSLGEECGRRK